MSDVANKNANKQSSCDWNTIKIGSKSFTVEHNNNHLIDNKISQNRNQKAKSTAKLIGLDIPYSYAYVKKQNKSQCGLCRLWFDKESLHHKIPNYLLLKLQSSWNYNRTGSRFLKPSFLYANSSVCLFCTQFFEDKVNSDHSGVQQPQSSDDIIKFDTPEVPLITTNISRRDLAIQQRCYQSSVVDDLGAINAVNPPYSKGSKTRLEIDPWWEVDLGVSRHVHSISLQMCRKQQQAMSVYLILLHDPIGFENPSLDRILPVCYLSKIFTFTSSKQSELESKVWELPEDCSLRAVRVQIQGSFSLHLHSLQILQGNALELPVPVLQPPLLLSSYDTTHSSPTMSTINKNNGKNMNNNNNTGNTGNSNTGNLEERDDNWPNESSQLSFAAVPRSLLMKKKKKIIKPVVSNVIKVKKLSAVTDEQYATLYRWKSRAAEAVSFFDEDPADGLLGLRDCIFNAVVHIDANRNNQSIIRKEDMRSSGLMQSEPRCALAAVYQSRQHMKEIGVLMRCGSILELSSFSNLEAIFDDLKLVFNYLETGSVIQNKQSNNINGYDSQVVVSSMSTGKSTLSPLGTSRTTSNTTNATLTVPPPNNNAISTATTATGSGAFLTQTFSTLSLTSLVSTSSPRVLSADTGSVSFAPMTATATAINSTSSVVVSSPLHHSCSWSQFLIIMQLLCEGKVADILEEAFGVNSESFLNAVKPIAPVRRLAPSLLLSAMPRPGTSIMAGGMPALPPTGGTSSTDSSISNNRQPKVSISNALYDFDEVFSATPFSRYSPARSDRDLLLSGTGNRSITTATTSKSRGRSRQQLDSLDRVPGMSPEGMLRSESADRPAVISSQSSRKAGGVLLRSQLSSPSNARSNNNKDIQNTLSKTAPGQLEGSSIFTSNLEYEAASPSTTGTHTQLTRRRISLIDDPWSSIERVDTHSSSNLFDQDSPPSVHEWQYEDIEMSPERGRRSESVLMINSKKKKKNVSKKQPVVSLRAIAGLENKQRMMRSRITMGSSLGYRSQDRLNQISYRLEENSSLSDGQQDRLLTAPLSLSDFRNKSYPTTNSSPPMVKHTSSSTSLSLQVDVTGSTENETVMMMMNPNQGGNHTLDLLTASSSLTSTNHPSLSLSPPPLKSISRSPSKALSQSAAFSPILEANASANANPIRRSDTSKSMLRITDGSTRSFTVPSNAVESRGANRGAEKSLIGIAAVAVGVGATNSTPLSGSMWRDSTPLTSFDDYNNNSNSNSPSQELANFEKTMLLQRTRSTSAYSDNYEHSSEKPGGRCDSRFGAAGVFFKRCALCVRKFPKDALEGRVMYKHILTLRKKWKTNSSAAVPPVSSSQESDEYHPLTFSDSFHSKQSGNSKFLNDNTGNIQKESILQRNNSMGGKSNYSESSGRSSQLEVPVEGKAGMALYRLVPVCLFCNQFFDPEVEGGISAPSVDAIQQEETTMTVILEDKSETAMTKYFDDRYLEDIDHDGIGGGGGGLMKTEEVRQSRARARKALEVAKELEKSQLISLDRLTGGSHKK